jgi:hypothetical protein
MAQVRSIEHKACSMTVKALMPVPMNLVAPLPHEGTAMHTTVTAGPALARTGVVSPVIGSCLRQGDVDSAIMARPGIRTSTTATRTTTTTTTSCVPEPSADSNLFDQIVAAYIDCRRTKRNSASALAFEAHLERNLCDLHDELANGIYSPGRAICFVITRPKAREVWAASFRDRIVHHLLYRKIAPRFIAGFTADSCACLAGRGTLYGAQRLEHQVRSITQNWSRPAHYLKLDLANFFVSISKPILMDLLAKKINEPWWLALTEQILMNDPRHDYELRGRPDLMARVPEHKRLMNAPADTGLPIGNLSSQFFANVLLNELDQFVKHRLKCRHYVRYVDDFILLSESPQQLNQWREAIEQFLPERLGVRINPSKTILQPVSRGVDFVGHVIKPWRRATRPRSVRVAIQRIHGMPAEQVYAAGNSYLGLIGQASHPHADRIKLAQALLARGHCVKSDLSKIYRRSSS